MYDVAVIGAGVIGGMIARELSAYKLKICILEKENDVAMGASKANSGIVHAGFDAKEGSLKAKFNVEGAQMMPKVAQQLGVKYQNNGSLVIGFDSDDEKTIKNLWERGKLNGVKGLEFLKRDELVKLEENISDNAICALYAPSGGIICPYELTIAAIGNAMDNGAELVLNFNVAEIAKENDMYIIKSNENEVKARFVINAAGLYSDRIASMVGDNSFTIHPRRGEYMLLDKKCGKLVNSTVFRTPSKMGKGILVSPTVDGNLLLGPTSVDSDDRTNRDTTAEGLREILSQTSENVKNIETDKVITSFTGLRAVGDTGDFIINSPMRGFINVAGIESPGLTSAPAIAKYVAEMINEQNNGLIKKDNFNPWRKSLHAFKDADEDEKNRIIRENPAYGRVVCRCETVTEGEILQAIRQNPGAHDLDGVKRRTRAQMGRCQGGFCSLRITELLAEEMKIPYEKVTKFGGESYVNIRKTKEIK